MKLSARQEITVSVGLALILFSLTVFFSFRAIASLIPLESAAGADIRFARFIVLFGSSLGMLVATLAIALARREFTKRRTAEESTKVFSTATVQTTDLVMVTDANGTITYVNKALEEATGFSAAKLVGKSWELLKSGSESETFFKDMLGGLLAGRPFQAVVTKRKENGELVSLRETITPITNREGRIARFVSTGKDITYEKALEKQVDQLAHLDALTALPGRNLFITRLNEELEKARNAPGLIAVMVADVDRLMLMNDVFGLDGGDDVLKAVAAGLAGALHEEGLAARLGSDEFGIFVKNLASPADVIQAAKRTLKSVSRPIKVQGEDVYPTIAVGLALYPEDGADAATLVKHADTALAQAKRHGKNNFQFYSKDLSKHASERMNMERSLFTALDNQEYLLTYQPYHELPTRNIAGAEALIRWKHATLGLVPPLEFIPTLEDTGMIVDVGEWVLRTACQQLKEWDTKPSRFPVSVNLSGVQFRHRYLIETVDGAIKDFNIDPTHLTLELTESILMHDLNLASGILKKLKNIGLSISVDDFGTGYSSLSYLKKLPVDFVKIDKSFVNDVTTDPDAASIITAITTMARSLNLKTIAEGIENEEQLKILHLLRCDMGQGYYFTPALPPEDMEKYLGTVARVAVQPQ